MFDAKSKNVEGPGTIVGANVKLSGILKDINDITVHGEVEGEVTSEKTVIIEKTARVKGPINAKLVIVAGKINGEITASEKLEILETGEVKGSISTNDLIIKSGAIFIGKSKMKEEIREKIAPVDKEKDKKPIIKTEKINKENPKPKIENKKYELE